MYLCDTGSMSYVFKLSRFLRYSRAPFIVHAATCETCVKFHILFPNVSRVYVVLLLAYSRSEAKLAIWSRDSITLCSFTSFPSIPVLVSLHLVFHLPSPRSRVFPDFKRHISGVTAFSTSGKAPPKAAFSMSE